VSRRVGWRLRRKNRLSSPVLSLNDKREEKKQENKSIEVKRLAAERYIRSIGG